MFKKFVTTIWPDGKTTVDHNRPQAYSEIEDDRAYEHKRLSEIARGANNIQTVEETERTIVVIYQGGRVIIYHWVDTTDKV